MGATGLFFLRMLCFGDSSPSESIGFKLDAKALLLELPKRMKQCEFGATELSQKEKQGKQDKTETPAAPDGLN
jgi:hypothetical protein